MRSSPEWGDATGDAVDTRSVVSWESASRPSRAAWRVVSVVGIVVVVAACAASPGPGAADPGRARDRAEQVLKRWADAAGAAGAGAGVTPVGDLTSQIGDWEPDVGDNNKRALMSGLVAPSDPLSDMKPPDGQVIWADGATATVALMSPQEAVAAIGAGAEPCEDCIGLLVTDARLTTAAIETTRGPATGPIWEFGLVGTKVRLTRVALANPVAVPPLSDGDPSMGVAIDSANVDATGDEVTVAFVGAPDPGDKPCGEDYSAEAVESDLAVAIIVTRHPHVDLFGGGCSAVGARRTATATLSRPLGERVILDLQQGTPVRIDRP